MGDGGFWHNGLQSGVLSALFNEGDAILIIMQNGCSSATGQQNIPSSRSRTNNRAITGEIERTLKSLGVEWLKTIRTYSVDVMVDTLREAMTTDFNGLKVIIAGWGVYARAPTSSQNRQRRKLEGGIRFETPRFGIDDEVCTGITPVSGFPAAHHTIKPNPDPLRTDPIAHVNNGCVGCGLCGEVSHAAVLCPSFYKAERVQNAGPIEKAVHKIRQSVIGRMSDRGNTA